VTLVTGKTLPPKTAGRLRTRHIQLTAGDRVRVEVSVCDQERGRIVGRN
jgi:translation initiation factor IF-1